MLCRRACIHRLSDSRSRSKQTLLNEVRIENLGGYWIVIQVLKGGDNRDIEGTGHDDHAEDLKTLRVRTEVGIYRVGQKKCDDFQQL